jgi:adenine phosphoribosyltransferase
MDLKRHIREVPDFPKPGILFYDISTLLAHAEAWRETVRRLVAGVELHRPDLLLGIESRGFLVAAPLAYALGCGFAMIRKRGKLPGPTIPSPTTSNTGPIPSKSKRMRWPRDSVWSSLTICWRPAAP